MWTAYLAIPGVLLYFSARRKNLPFRKVFILFGAFILFCGTTHLMEAVIFWWPAYRLAGVLKLGTAIVSWATVFALIPIVPKALAMRSPEELEREVAARKRTEEALQHANAELEQRVEARTMELTQALAVISDERELLQTTLASIGDAVITTDTHGLITNMNAGAESLIGWTYAESVGQPLETLFRIVNEDTRQPVPNPVTKVLRDRVTVSLANHTILISKDGTERPIDDSAAPIRTKEGEILGSVLCFRDISERKLAETNRLAVQEHIAKTMESVTDGFIRYGRDWRIVYANAESGRIHNLARWEMIGNVLWNVFPAVVGTKLETEYRRAVAEQVTVEFEIYDEQFDSWYSHKGYPTPDGGLTTFIRKLTEDKIQQDRVHRSEARLRRVFESNVAGMILWNLDQNLILDANDFFLNMTGYTREDVAAGRLNFRDMTPPEWMLRNEEAILNLHSEGYAPAYEKEYFRKDGSRLPLIIAGTRFEDSPSEGMSILIDISESKRAEQEIARLADKSERQRRLYETILASTPDFVYVLSLDHKVIYANDALIKMWGRGYDGAIGKTFLEIGYEPWHAEMHDREIDQVRATGQPIRGEVPFEGTNGRRQYDYIFAPILGVNGEVEAVAGVTRDVTDRKGAEEALRRSVEEVQTLMNTLPIGVFVAEDPECRLITGNAAAKAMMRTQSPNLSPISNSSDATLPFRPFRNGVEIPPDQTPIQRAARGESVRDEEVEDVFEDGTVLHTLMSAAPLYDGQGLVRGAVATVLDVTERKRHDKEIEDSRRTLQAVIERCPFGIYIVDGDFRIASMTDGAQAGAFANVRPAVGRAFDVAMRILWPEPTATEVIQRFRQTLETGEPYSSQDFVNPRADIAQTEGYEWELHRITMQDGRLGVVCYYYDSTILRQTEAKLRQLAASLSESDRRKTEFLAMLAHELRNPLAPIRNVLQILRVKGEGQDAVRSASEIIERQVGQMVRLVDDLLDVSRVSRGKIELRKERVTLKSIIQQAEEAVNPMCEAMNHKLTVTMPLSPIEVNGDPVRLIQIFSNLLTNACKFTDPGGRIALTIARVSDQAVIRVRDNGIGISAHNLPHLFQIFMQADTSIDRRAAGLGIGLALVKDLVEMHDGSVEAHSDGIGKGSEFVVILPALPAEEQPPLTELPQADVSAINAEEKTILRILVVDDNQDSADSLALLLKLDGHVTHTAYDGPQALEAVATFHPNAVLLDIGLPTLNGYETCRRIRDQFPRETIRLIALTGWGQEEDLKNTAEAGFDAHLVKPVDYKTLMSVLLR